MRDTLIFVLVAAAWVTFQLTVLPRLGVKT